MYTQQYLLKLAIIDEMLQLPPIWTRVLVPLENMMISQLARISTQASIVNMLRNGITYFIEAGDSALIKVYMVWYVFIASPHFPCIPLKFSQGLEVFRRPQRPTSRVFSLHLFLDAPEPTSISHSGRMKTLYKPS